MPAAEWPAAARLQQGRHGGAHRLYGLHVARQTVRHQDPGRSARACRVSEGRRIFLYPARAAQFLLRELPRAERGRTYPYRGARARARPGRGAADLSFGMGRHGHDQPAPDVVQQPGSRGAAQARGRTIPRRLILSFLHEQRAADLRSRCTAVRGSNRMRRFAVTRLAAAALLAASAATAFAATADDFKAALAKAEAANKTAGALKNQWTTTADALKAAQAAAAAGKFDEAVKDAQQAEALANASIAQAKEQAAAWQKAVIR